jgi:hypothetical protein
MADMTESKPEVAHELGNIFKIAEMSLRDALKVLHDQEDRGEFFNRANGASLCEWAGEIADLAESVKRNV